MASKHMLQKKKCIRCHKQGIPRVTINKKHHICEDCMAKERQAMLDNPNHPGWQYYNILAAALGMKAKTDD